MFSFLAILLNYTDWAITGWIARVQFNSTLERKVKTGALKGIFLVCKWINNTIKSNSVRYHMYHRKNLSFLSSFRLRMVFDKGSKIAVLLSIVTSKWAWWPPLIITFLSSPWLVTSVYHVSSIIYVRFVYYGITLRNHKEFVWRQQRIITPSIWAASSNKGCSLGTQDWRILCLLHRILPQMFGSLWLFFNQTWSLFQKIVPQCYNFLPLQEFLMKTLHALSTMIVSVLLKKV